MFFLIVLLVILLLIILAIVISSINKNKKHPYNYIPPYKYYNKNIDYSKFPEQYDLKTIAKYIGGNDSNKLTYFNSNINSNNFDIISYIQKQLIKNGWRIADVENGEFVNFSFSQGGGSDKKQGVVLDEAFSQKALALCGEIINLGLEFSNKKSMQKHFGDKSYFPKWSPGKLLIQKNDQSIKISTEALVASSPDIIQEQYISNPLLYEGKKFNLQVYLAIYARDADAANADAGNAANAESAFIQAIINSNYNMQVSALPYSNSDYDNTDIHISNKNKSQITPLDTKILTKLMSL